MFITSTVRNKIMEKIGDNITTVITTDITTHGRDDWGESPQSTSRIRHEVMQAEREFFICANSL